MNSKHERAEESLIHQLLATEWQRYLKGLGPRKRPRSGWYEGQFTPPATG